MIGDMADEASGEPSGFSKDVVNHWQHFYDDGNIVLRAQGKIARNPGDEEELRTVLYRVHKSLLTIHSPIFRDMFSASSPSAGDDTYDGVPVVDMPDKAYDIQLLLDSIYAPTYV